MGRVVALDALFTDRRIWRGQAVAAPRLGTYRQNVYLTRYDESFFLEGDGYEPLASGGV